jgi:hypothetical protein
MRWVSHNLRRIRSNQVKSGTHKVSTESGETVGIWSTCSGCILLDHRVKHHDSG